MRVLTIGSMYPPHHLGGYELMWRSAVEHLRTAGHEVRVLATRETVERPDPEIADGADVHRELEWYWRDHRFPRRGLWRSAALERRNLAVLDRHLREFAPAAVSWWAMGGMSMSLVEAIRRDGPPAMGAVVDDWMVYGPLVDAWQRRAGRRGVAPVAERLTGIPTRLRLGAAAHWLFVSEAVRMRARERHPDLDRSAVAHAGIDPEAFPPAPEKPWRWKLLYLGRIDGRKGIDVAVRALESLPSASLRVVGSGDVAYLGELRALIDGLGLRDRVSFDTISRDQVAGAYAAADVTLFPVRWEEPFGLVPLESMSVGTPVVATGTGGSGEYLRDNDNCVIVPRNDPEAVAGAVRRLAADPRLRARLREGGVRTASELTEVRFNRAVERALESAGR